jgi:hypothetical protein
VGEGEGESRDVICHCGHVTTTKHDVYSCQCRRLFTDHTHSYKFCVEVNYKMGKKDYCCAPNCDHRRSKGAKCSFYVLPKGPQWLRDAWLQRICDNGLTWTPTSNSRLCGCHIKVPEDTHSRLPGRNRYGFHNIPDYFVFLRKTSKRRIYMYMP